MEGMILELILMIYEKVNGFGEGGRGKIEIRKKTFLYCWGCWGIVDSRKMVV